MPTVLVGLVLFLAISAAPARAELPAIEETNYYRNLQSTVKKVEESPGRYRKPGPSRQWAERNLSSGLKNLKASVWRRHSDRLESDRDDEIWARAISEQKATDLYDDDLEKIAGARKAAERLATRATELRSQVCLLKYQRVQAGKSAKSRRKAKLINKQRRRAAIKRQSLCRTTKQKQLKDLSSQIRKLSEGIEIYRQAFIDLYLDRMENAEKATIKLRAGLRQTSNETTRSELNQAVILANRARRLIDLPVAPVPRPELGSGNQVQSEYWGMMDAGNLNYERAALSGVGAVRQGIWFDRAGGNTVNWQHLDRRFRLAANQGIRNLAVVCPENHSIRDIKAAAKRYGPGGEFWKGWPGQDLPVRVWEICNEPNIGLNSAKGQADPEAYTGQLVRASRAIRSVDRTAIILIGGLANVLNTSRNISAADFLKRVYRLPESRGSFDGLSIHPYEVNPEMSLAALSRVREVMSANGDSGKGSWITEIGWSTGGPKSRYRVSMAEQADYLTRITGLLEAYEDSFQIRAVYWYFWRDTDQPIGHASRPNWDSYAGLFTVDGDPKPAWPAWLQATEARAGKG